MKIELYIPEKIDKESGETTSWALYKDVECESNHALDVKKAIEEISEEMLYRMMVTGIHIFKTKLVE